MATHCGKAYSGRLISNDEADVAMRGAAMVMHVRRCSDSRIEVPFHIQTPNGDWDRSRTWVLTRTDTGLRLKHDHRHRDGSAAVLTQYGGDTDGPGTARLQRFPVDADSRALFVREKRTVSLTNVWEIEVDPATPGGGTFTYRLRRAPPDARDFQVVFDLARPVIAPPAPWGHGGA